ncbi:MULTISPECIES: ABC transporter permease [Thermodesulfovibrio]|jgi:Nod factor-specific ABC transporter NodJ protein|uniref:Transport permease protein n=2 Tax=Thermodesulfovibrio TaxID=28261 RepID=A0A2J6WNF9_9BACT|nr:MAG: ABC transporter [Thermodesulfovibrio aggregans]
MTGWYPVFLKEMLQFRRKLLRLGYIFSAMMAPIIYLVTFGLGLGKTVKLSEGTDYLTFLLPGLVAMSSMNNSYSWVASSLNLSRLYFKTFQVYIQSPIKPFSIMIGEVMAGMVKGLFASLLIIVVGFVVPSKFSINLIFILTLLLNCFMFACLGVITGMITKSHEDTATYSNFFIMPMAFFSGTFFSIDRIPLIFKPIIYIMPLTHTNILIRKSYIDTEAMISLSLILFYCLCFFLIGSTLMKKYSE